MATHPLSRGRIVAVAGLLAIAFAGASHAAGTAAVSYSYRSLDYPGSTQTIFWGIDDLGRLAGEYAIANGTPHAMTYRHGDFAPLDPAQLGTNFSAAGGPTDAGTTYGGYDDDAGVAHGFTSRQSKFETVDFAGHLNSNVDGMNLSGTILGVTWEADLTYHGIVQAKDGTQTPFDVPGARDTYPLGINEGGASVGYWDADGVTTHGYLRAADGTISTLDVPGAAATAAFGINERGQVTGYFVDAAGAIHGFVEKSGHFQQLDMPGAAATIATCINNLGTVAGEYIDAEGARHGFTAKPQ